MERDPDTSGVGSRAGTSGVNSRAGISDTRSRVGPSGFSLDSFQSPDPAERRHAALGLFAIPESSQGAGPSQGVQGEAAAAESSGIRPFNPPQQARVTPNPNIPGLQDFLPEEHRRRPLSIQIPGEESLPTNARRPLFRRISSSSSSGSSHGQDVPLVGAGNRGPAAIGCFPRFGDSHIFWLRS